jgi:DNA-binding response OmpR family regulator
MLRKRGLVAKVLVVDDEVNQARALEIGLRLEGFEVTSALEAETALRSLATDPVDIAIVDLMLPGRNGIELARELHALYPAMRVLLTSAYHLSRQQILRADCGVIGFVPKPYHLDELAQFLRMKLAAGIPPGPESCRVLGAAAPLDSVAGIVRRRS